MIDRLTSLCAIAIAWFCSSPSSFAQEVSSFDIPETDFDRIANIGIRGHRSRSGTNRKRPADPRSLISAV